MKRIPVLTMLTALVALWTMAIFGFIPSVAEAAVPRLINFQGVVKDSAGNTPAVDMLGITFTIYDAPLGGAVLWTETQSITIVAGGLFNVLLGSTSPVPDSVFEDTVRYIGIRVESDPEMLPRQRLVSVGYSYRVGTVDGATGGVIYGNTSIQSDLAVVGAMDAKNLVLKNPGPLETPLSIEGSVGQTANLMEIKDGAGVPLVSVNANGDMDGLNSSWENVGAIDINCDGSLNVNGPAVVQADVGQTANLQEWRIPLPGGGLSTAMKIGPNGDVTTGPLQVDASIALNLTTVTQTDCGLTLDKFHSIVIVDYSAVAPDTVCTINLPTAAGIKGRTYTIKRARYLATPQVVIDPYLSETIDNGLLMYLATPGNYATIVSDGTNWQTIAFGNSP